MKRCTALLTLLAIALATTSAAQRKIRVLDPIGVLLLPEVQQDLKLSPDKVAEIRSIEGDYRRDMQTAADGGVHRGTVEEVETALGAIGLKHSARIEALLTPEQKERLNELELQLGAPDILLKRRYSEALKLSNEQQTRIKAVQEKFMNQLIELQLYGGLTGPELTKQRGQLKKEGWQEIESILNEDQKQTLIKLRGKPIS